MARLTSPDNLVNKLVQIRDLHSRDTAHKNIPPLIQTLAVETAIVTSERAAAQEFGVAHQTVNYYKNDGKAVDRDKVKDDISKVHNNALECMLESINLIRPKLATVKKVTDLSKVAADMSRVIEKTTPKELNQQNLKVVVFAPNMKVENDYEEMVVPTIP